MQLNDLLQRLHNVKPGRDGQYTACCPCHDDRRNSLSVGQGEDGKILLHCHAGCDTADVASVLGLAIKDFFVEPPKRTNNRRRPAVVATYTYRDDNGNVLAEKQRRADKSFMWRQPDGKGGWTWGRKGVPHRLYVAGTMENAVFICEGEKDADNIAKLGFCAVSGENGAGPGKWLPEYTQQLKGKSVAIFSDNDDVGKAYAVETANALHGVAAGVQVLDLATVWPDIPEHGDVSDLIEKVGTEQTLELIMGMIGNTPMWEPTVSTSSEQAEKLPLVSACDIAYEPPRWLLAPYFQRGKGTLIQSDPGTGKTAFMCAIAAHISTGTPLLGLTVENPGDVLILSVEDDLPVLRGRLEANGADLTKCHFLTNAAGLNFLSPEIEQAVKQIKAKLIVFDPLQAFLGSNIDMFRANETRPALAKLFEMCDRNDCACAIISHMGKNSFGKSPINQSLGSVDIPAAMRSVLQIAKNPEDETECIAVHIKCSNAPKGQSIAYSIVDRGGVEWHGFSNFSAEDLTITQKRKEKGVPYENEPLVQVFNQLITDRPGGGFWSYADLKVEGAKILGFPPYSDINDLRQRLNGPLSRELQTKDGLIVTTGVKGAHGVRGIRIEQYRLPDGYQTRLTGG